MYLCHVLILAPVSQTNIEILPIFMIKLRMPLVSSLSLLLLAACTGQKASDTESLALPVSEKQLCLDWYTAFETYFEEVFDDDDENPFVQLAPKEYIVTDLDHDGLAEVLMQGEASPNAAILSYDKDGKVKFMDITNDGYLTLGVGDGWYVREFDNHMGEFRNWTKYYYEVKDGEFDFIGDRTVGFEGLDDEGEYIEMEPADGTDGKAPADSLITLYYNLHDWIRIGDDAKAEALSVLEDGEGSEERGMDEGSEDPEDFVSYHAGEVTLADGTRLRLDYKIDANGNVSGETTYYRSSGKTSKIPFFGNQFYDRFVNQDFVRVYEHYNGKCCGQMIWSLNDQNELNSGSWYLRDKSLMFDTYEVKEPVTEVGYTSPSLDFKLADQLLPCSRQTLKDLFAQAYPESGPANYFMMVDMDNDGTFEVFVENGFGSAPKTALIWMQNGEPQVMGFGSKHQVYLHMAGMYVKSEEGSQIYRWVDGVPSKDPEEDNEEEIQFFDNYSLDMNVMGEWLNM